MHYADRNFPELDCVLVNIWFILRLFQRKFLHVPEVDQHLVFEVLVDQIDGHGQVFE